MSKMQFWIPLSKYDFLYLTLFISTCNHPFIAQVICQLGYYTHPEESRSKNMAVELRNRWNRNPHTEFHQSRGIQPFVSHLLCFLKSEAISNIFHKSRVDGCIRLPKHHRDNQSFLRIIVTATVQEKDIDLSIDDLSTSFVLQRNC